MLIPGKLKNLIEEEDLLIINKYFIPALPDSIGSCNNRYITLVAEEHVARDIFRKFGAILNNIKSLNEGWSKKFIKINHSKKNIVKITLFWDNIGFIDGQIEYIEDQVLAVEMLENFKYTRDAINTLKYLIPYETMVKITKEPEKNWSGEFIKVFVK